PGAAGWTGRTERSHGCRRKPKTMNRKDECQELFALLRSRFPVILIESNEEPRILELLQQAANLENQVLMTWSITHGIRRHGRDDAIYQTNDLLEIRRA